MDYQLSPMFLGRVNSVARKSDDALIPLAEGNRDCQKFLADWKAGATVFDADGAPAPYSDVAVIALGLTPPADE